MNTLQKVGITVGTLLAVTMASATPAQASYKDFEVKSEIYTMEALPGGSVALMFKTTVQNKTNENVYGIRVRHRFKDEFAAKRTDVTVKDVFELIENSNCDTQNYKREIYGVKAVISDCSSLFAKPGENKYYEAYIFSKDYVKRFTKGKELPVVTTRFFAEADQPQKALPKSAFKLDLTHMTSTQTEFRED